jgi:MATE family, multidrug efflux pump
MAADSASRRELSEIVRLAVPMMAAQGGLMLMGVVDTLIVGRVSSLEMAAVSLGNSVIGVLLVFVVGIAMGIEPLVSQAIGAGEPEQARAWLWQGIYLTAIVAVPVAALSAAMTLSFAPIGIERALADRATAFIWARLPGLLLATGAYACFRSYFGCIGRPHPVLLAVVLANFLNAFVDWVLVFGNLGAPRLGAVGAGLSTSTATAFMAGLLAFAVRTSHPVRGAAVGPRASDLVAIAKLGWPIGLQISAEVGIFTFASTMIARFGESQLAGHQVAITLASLSYMCAVGIANATTARVGFHVGANHSRMARRVGFLGISAGGTFMAGAGACYAIFRNELAALFAPTDARAAAVGASLLAIASVFAVFDGIQTVSAGALRGAGDTKWPFLSNLIAYWAIALPVALYLAHAEGLGPAGYWWGLTAGLFGVAVILLVRFHLVSSRDIARAR